MLLTVCCQIPEDIFRDLVEFKSLGGTRFTQDSSCVFNVVADQCKLLG